MTVAREHRGQHVTHSGSLMTSHAKICRLSPYRSKMAASARDRGGRRASPRSRNTSPRPPSCTPATERARAHQRKSSSTNMISMSRLLAAASAASTSVKKRSSNASGAPSGANRIPVRPSHSINQRIRRMPAIASRSNARNRSSRRVCTPPAGRHAFAPKSPPYAIHGRFAPTVKPLIIQGYPIAKYVPVPFLWCGVNTVCPCKCG